MFSKYFLRHLQTTVPDLTRIFFLGSHFSCSQSSIRYFLLKTTAPQYFLHVRPLNRDYLTFSLKTKMSLKKVDEPLSDGSKLRLYSSNICPYAQRSRLVLAAKGIPYEVSEIDLKTPRPDWYLKDLNPNGTVPAMLHNGHNIYESLVCCDYLEEVFPDPPLYNPDPLKRAFERIYIQTWASKGIPAFYKLFKEHPITDEAKENLLNAIGKMDSLLKESKSDYFSGTNRAGMADYMIWPWFERILFFNQLAGFKVPESDYPSITAWMSRLLKDKAVREANTSRDNFTAAFKMFHPEE